MTLMRRLNDFWGVDCPSLVAKTKLIEYLLLVDRCWNQSICRSLAPSRRSPLHRYGFVLGRLLVFGLAARTMTSTQPHTRPPYIRALRVSDVRSWRSLNISRMYPAKFVTAYQAQIIGLGSLRTLCVVRNPARRDSVCWPL